MSIKACSRAMARLTTSSMVVAGPVGGAGGAAWVVAGAACGCAGALLGVTTTLGAAAFCAASGLAGCDAAGCAGACVDADGSAVCCATALNAIAKNPVMRYFEVLMTLVLSVFFPSQISYYPSLTIPCLTTLTEIPRARWPWSPRRNHCVVP